MPWVKMNKALALSSGEDSEPMETATEKYLFKNGHFNDYAIMSLWGEARIVDGNYYSKYTIGNGEKHLKSLTYIDCNDYSTLSITFDYNIVYGSIIFVVGTSDNGSNINQTFFTTVGSETKTMTMNVASYDKVYITFRGSTGSGSGNWIEVSIKEIKLTK